MASSARGGQVSGQGGLERVVMIELGNDPPEASPETGAGADFPGLAVRREEPAGKTGWNRPLVIAMALAVVAGVGVAAALSVGGRTRPAVAAKASDEDGQPTRLLQIQVKNAPPKTPAGPTTIMPAPVAVASAAAPSAAPAPVRSHAPPVPSAPNPPATTAERARPAPLDLDALADPEMAGADRELATAIREARAAGVPPRELQAEREAWRSDRAEAADSRGALLDAYQDHIDDLRDLADDAGRSARRYDRHDRYAGARGDDDEAYTAPYPGYGRPY